MAVGPRQTNSNNRYDPAKDFTLDQLRRFGHTANQAQNHRELEKKLAELTKNSQPQVSENPIKAGKNKKENTSLRYAVWLFIALVVTLYFMYITA